ncbi:MAG TPA: tRNA preQ1(34) S-adenosylmethionine ribosyltransferase-isomerase QueA [Burkholderiales bacterium]|nr:tRNA preQ1(34) S-adenosylmethionine ribosyltransferase-isomerase QueA [Burkholderiales bacterium]
MPLTLEDFDYPLPADLIAQFPAPERAASRLLQLAGENLSDHRFAELPRFLRPGDVLVFNDTRVIKARLYGVKASGGKIEVLVERITGAREALVQMRASHPPRPGARICFDTAIEAEVLERRGDLYLLRFAGTASVLELLERHGHLPLPPYIAHADSEEDQARYQTVYARRPGAVAAPTAGLHFDEPMLARLRAMGVHLAWLTLHVGAGTFQPVRVSNLAEHKMHSEYYDIPPATVQAVAGARAAGRAVIAVGTTSLRALESAAGAGALRNATDGDFPAGAGETDLFITPGYRFRVVDRLITNFHLPRSTLLMLVAAFAGMEEIRAAYEHAIAQRYRFFSYGDAMLIDRIERAP